MKTNQMTPAMVGGMVNVTDGQGRYAISGVLYEFSVETETSSYGDGSIRVNSTRISVRIGHWSGWLTGNEELEIDNGA